MSEEEVEFNNGFVTALALFYGHREQFRREAKDVPRLAMHDLRIYGASDHLYDIEYPQNLSPELKREIEQFVKDVFSHRLTIFPVEEGDKLFDKCLELLKKIDKECFKVEAEVKFP